jgi:hypothetical protein
VLVQLLLQLNEFGKTWIVYKFLFQKSRPVFGESPIYRWRDRKIKSTAKKIFAFWALFFILISTQVSRAL